MTLSTKEKNAITAFVHADVRRTLRTYGWDKTEFIEHDHEEFCLDDNASVWVPLDGVPFDWCDDEELVETFAERLDISTFEAINILAGKLDINEPKTQAKTGHETITLEAATEIFTGVCFNRVKSPVNESLTIAYTAILPSGYKIQSISLETLCHRVYEAAVSLSL